MKDSLKIINECINNFEAIEGISLEELQIIKNDLKAYKDKEIPKNPKTIKRKGYKGSEWVCPNCKEHIAYFDELGIGTVRAIKYCEECGQRLNLGSDEDDE